LSAFRQTLNRVQQVVADDGGIENRHRILRLRSFGKASISFAHVDGDALNFRWDRAVFFGRQGGGWTP
jgi:hypothetical protein